MNEKSTSSANDSRQIAVSSVLRSGFPLQTAVRNAISLLPECTVEAEERPWRDSPDSDEFLDILAQKKTLSLAIECKKKASEALTFLDTSGIDKQTAAAVATRQRFKRETYYVGRAKRGRVHLAPASWEAMYCVASSNPGILKWTPFLRQGVKVDSQRKESTNGSSESSSFQGVVQG